MAHAEVFGKRIQTLDILRTYAQERTQGTHLPHAGDVTPREAWEYLANHPDGVLIDVRTQPEWQFVGEVDLSQTASRKLNLSWKFYPSFSVNPDFVAEVKKIVPEAKTPIFFLCRSGGRSLDAAVAMAQEGYEYCFNILEGFEGDPDANGHRVAGGWKAEGLPWKQS